MHFERQNAFQNHTIIFSEKKKKIEKICVPTLPKIFRPVTLNKLILLFGLIKNDFSYFNRNVCCGYSKEPELAMRSQDVSFEHPKHMFKLMG